MLPHGDASSSLWLPEADAAVVEIVMRKIKSSRQKLLQMQCTKSLEVYLHVVSVSIASFRRPKGALCFVSTETGTPVFAGVCPVVNERAT